MNPNTMNDIHDQENVYSLQYLTIMAMKATSIYKHFVFSLLNFATRDFAMVRFPGCLFKRKQQINNIIQRFVFVKVPLIFDALLPSCLPRRQLFATRAPGGGELNLANYTHAYVIVSLETSAISRAIIRWNMAAPVEKKRRRFVCWRKR
jgi:hypothetical protein